MDANERYLKDLEFLKNSTTEEGKNLTEEVIAKLLGRGKTYFTDKKGGDGTFVKKFTLEDLVWLHYVFNEILENPVIGRIEVEGKKEVKAVKKASGVNSGGQGLTLETEIELLEQHLRKLLPAIEQFQKSAVSLKIHTGNALMLLAQSKIRDNANKKDKAEGRVK